MTLVRTAIASLALMMVSGTASAQGLIWSLPEDGTSVKYEGTYEQNEINPDAAAGNLVIKWIRHVTVKSVGKEDAEFDGATVPCRWIEIKVETGTEREGGIDPGPGGRWIVKVLVPEARVTGQVQYGDEIPVAFLPIVKGFRKIDRPERNAQNELEVKSVVEPIETKVLNIYPLLSPMMHYRTLESAGEEEIDVPKLGRFSARKFTGKLTIESPTVRVENTADFWASQQVPFGLAKWSVKQTRYLKDRASTRDQFKPVSEVTAEISANAVTKDAQSEIAAP